jgi:hypothetical protein
MYWLRVSVWKQCEQKIEYPGGPLAQLVEQLTLNQRAVGSTPTRPTKPHFVRPARSSSSYHNLLRADRHRK